MPKIADIAKELKCELLDPEGKAWKDEVYNFALRDALLEVLDSEDSANFTTEYTQLVEVQLQNGSCVLDMSSYEGCNVKRITDLACNVNGNPDRPDNDDEADEEEDNLTALDLLLSRYTMGHCKGQPAASSGLSDSSNADAFAIAEWDHVGGLPTAIRFSPAVPDEGVYTLLLSVYCPPDRNDDDAFDLDNVGCWDIPVSLLHLVRQRARAYLYNLDTDDEYTDARSQRELAAFNRAIDRRSIEQRLDDLRNDQSVSGRISVPVAPPSQQGAQ